MTTTQDTKTMAEHTKDIRARCYAFVSEQSAGEWDDKTIIADAEKLLAFVRSESGNSHDALVKALKGILKHGELGNVGTGGWAGNKPAGNPMSKDVWQFPRHMLTGIEDALAQCEQDRVGGGL